MSRILFNDKLSNIILDIVNEPNSGEAIKLAALSARLELGLQLSGSSDKTLEIFGKSIIDYANSHRDIKYVKVSPQILTDAEKSVIVGFQGSSKELLEKIVKESKRYFEI